MDRATNFPVIAGDSLWAPRFEVGDVVRVDMETNEIVATIPVSKENFWRGPQAIAAQGDDVWVSAEDDEGWALMRIESSTNQVAERIAVPGTPGWGISIIDQTLWMSSFERSRIVRVDLEARVVEAEINLPDVTGITAAEDGVWASSGGSGYVARIDPATNEMALVRIGMETGVVPMLTEDEVWIPGLYSQQVAILSRHTNEILDHIDLQWPNGIARQDDLMWVAEHSKEGSPGPAERIVAIDIATREIVRVIPMTGLGIDRGILVEGNTIWVVVDAGIARLEL